MYISLNLPQSLETKTFFISPHVGSIINIACTVCILLDVLASTGEWSWRQAMCHATPTDGVSPGSHRRPAAAPRNAWHSIAWHDYCTAFDNSRMDRCDMYFFPYTTKAWKPLPRRSSSAAPVCLWSSQLPTLSQTLTLFFSFSSFFSVSLSFFFIQGLALIGCLPVTGAFHVGKEKHASHAP